MAFSSLSVRALPVPEKVNNQVWTAPSYPIPSIATLERSTPLNFQHQHKGGRYSASDLPKLHAKRKSDILARKSLVVFWPLRENKDTYEHSPGTMTISRACKRRSSKNTFEKVRFLLSRISRKTDYYCRSLDKRQFLFVPLWVKDKFLQT